MQRVAQLDSSVADCAATRPPTSEPANPQAVKKIVAVKSARRIGEAIMEGKNLGGGVKPSSQNTGGIRVIAAVSGWTEYNIAGLATTSPSPSEPTPSPRLANPHPVDGTPRANPVI